MAQTFFCPSCNKQMELEALYDAVIAWTFEMDGELLERLDKTYEDETNLLLFQCTKCCFVLVNNRGEPIQDVEEMLSYVNQVNSTKE